MTTTTTTVTTVTYEGFRYQIRHGRVYGQTGARRNVRSMGAFTDRVVDEAYAQEIRQAAKVMGRQV